jgi:hypothetical protein
MLVELNDKQGGVFFMSVTKRAALPLALGGALILVAAMASTAIALTATQNVPHPTNGGALSQVSSVVIAFKQCTTGTNAKHGVPLAANSCNPPVQVSNNLTVGGTDPAAGGIYKTKGAAKLTIQVACIGGATGEVPPCSTTAGDQEDVKLIGTSSDVRCKQGGGVLATKCPNANAFGGKDYNGTVTSQSQIRITDRYNGTTTAGGTFPATVIDLPFSAGAQCVATAADTTTGSSCNISTTADTVVPGAAGSGGVVKEGKKASVEIAQIQIFDGGTDGANAKNPLGGTANTCPPSCIAAGDDTLYAVEGIYIP